MTDRTYPPAAGTATHVTGTASVANFIPEIWSDEIIAAYTANLVMANLVTRLNHVGKKGDTIHIPAPTRDSANAKAVATGVTIISNVEGKKDITITNHYEYSRLIEDIADIQGLDSFRMFYTEDAGRALALQVDTDLIRVARASQAATVGTNDYATAAASTNAVKGSDGSTAYNSSTSNAADLTDLGLRQAIETLDNANVPMDQRFLIVPPSQKNILLGMATGTGTALAGGFARADTSGDARAALRTGLIGDVYGIPVYVSTNVDYGAGTSGTDRICLLGHKEYMALVEQMNVRTQTQYKQEYLADLMTADTIYGVGELRTTSALALAVPA